VASERIRVGVVGLGDIARKAYLPVLAARADLELHLCTRDRETLDAVGNAYHLEHRHGELGELLSSGIDAAFVHVATPAHVEVVSRVLRAGAHAYVDKPLATTLDDCVRLAELARANDRSLMVGFNRRHAPVYRELLEPRPSLVFMQKNRVGLADTPRHVIFDDFVHVIDTLRFLAPQAELDDVRAVTRGARLELVCARLVGDGVTAIGSMNRNGGYTQELLETQGAGFRRVVRDMAQVDDCRDGQHVVVRRGDWTPTTAQRGFEAICDEFVASVRRGAVLDPADALRTHEMCERIVVEVERAVSTN